MVYSNVCRSANTFKRVSSSSILNVLSLTAPNNRLLVCVKYFYVTYVFVVIQNHRGRIRTSRHPLGARRNNLRLSASSRFFQMPWTISCSPVINQPFNYVPKKASIPLETCQRHPSILRSVPPSSLRRPGSFVLGKSMSQNAEAGRF